VSRAASTAGWLAGGQSRPVAGATCATVHAPQKSRAPNLTLSTN